MFKTALAILATSLVSTSVQALSLDTETYVSNLSKSETQVSIDPTQASIDQQAAFDLEVQAATTLSIDDLTTKQREAALALFTATDTDGSGLISYDEAAALVR